MSVKDVSILKEPSSKVLLKSQGPSWVKPSGQISQPNVDGRRENAKMTLCLMVGKLEQVQMHTTSVHGNSPATSRAIITWILYTKFLDKTVACHTDKHSLLDQTIFFKPNFLFYLSNFILFRYTWRIALYSFQAYNIMIWCLYMLQNDHHSKSS